MKLFDDKLNKIIKIIKSNNDEQIIEQKYSVIKYGTAGFRDKSDIILKYISDKICYLALYICYSEKWNRMGVMITASHNPVEDNGIKLVGQNGEMIPCEYESEITDLVNSNVENFKLFQNWCTELNYPFELILGYDLRPSSIDIYENIVENSYRIKCNLININVVTTPELHIKTVKPNFNYTKNFANFFNLCTSHLNPDKKYLDIIVDCANGCGLILMQKISSKINNVNFKLINIDKPQEVNYKCGAEYIHKEQKLPQNFNGKYHELTACFDGDADRLILFYLNEENKINIIDGDKIGVFMIKFIKKYLNILNIKADIAFVQTAYANTASTNYVKNILKIHCICVATGVKYLHHEAKKHDIGFYFESNGHGTTLFKESFIEKVKGFINNDDKSKVDAAIKILNFYQLINQFVGDAISSLLAICYIAITENINIIDWDKIYDNIPSKQYKIFVKNKDQIIVNENETKVLCPHDLQISIDEIIKHYDDCRAFIRPSGTENCVRLYVEYLKVNKIETISNQIKDKIKFYLD